MQKVKIKHPDYQGSRDEIIRLSIEHQFELKIKLKPCVCGGKPKEWFKSDTEYWVECQACGKESKHCKHLYEAKQYWNLNILEDANRKGKKNGR